MASKAASAATQARLRRPASNTPAVPPVPPTKHAVDEQAPVVPQHVAAPHTKAAGGHPSTEVKKKNSTDRPKVASQAGSGSGTDQAGEGSSVADSGGASAPPAHLSKRALKRWRARQRKLGQAAATTAASSPVSTPAGGDDDTGAAEATTPVAGSEDPSPPGGVEPGVPPPPTVPPPVPDFDPGRRITLRPFCSIGAVPAMDRPPPSLRLLARGCGSISPAMPPLHTGFALAVLHAFASRIGVPTPTVSVRGTGSGGGSRSRPRAVNPFTRAQQDAHEFLSFLLDASAGELRQLAECGEKVRPAARAFVCAVPRRLLTMSMHVSAQAGTLAGPASGGSSAALLDVNSDWKEASGGRRTGVQRTVITQAPTAVSELFCGSVRYDLHR